MDYGLNQNLLINLYILCKSEKSVLQSIQKIKEWYNTLRHSRESQYSQTQPTKNHSKQAARIGFEVLLQTNQIPNSCLVVAGSFTLPFQLLL